MEEFTRTSLLIGDASMKILNDSKVAIFGIGGVGGYVCEALARSGIGSFVLVDNDVVSKTNINRQIIATNDTIGKYKCEVMRDRILSINPRANIEIRNCFYLPDNAGDFNFKEYSYVVDCVDTITAKLSIVVNAKENNVKVISAMGAGNKLNPTMLEVSDIFKTSVDPLARVMRYELKKRGIKKLKVVYSKEEPIKVSEIRDDKSNKVIPGSTAFVPACMGIIIASEVVKDLIG